MVDLLQIKPELRWIHILHPSESDFKYLHENFHFHPLDIEDCKSINNRPKIDIYDDYYFMILHFPYYDKSNRLLVTKEVKVFWGKDYIITIGNSHWVVKEMFNKTKENKLQQELFLNKSSDKLLYIILEKLLNENNAILNRIGNELEFLNRDLFSKKAELIIEKISVSRKNLILLNTITKPQIRLFTKFESGDIKGFADEMDEYWGNILDYYHKTWDMVEDYEELIEGLSKTFDSLQANKTNEIMKVLTFFSSIMLPLTMITGMYGMNIGLPFQSYPQAFWIVLSAMVAIVLSLIFYFKRKKWM